eukprot:g22830.t1
MLNFSRVFVARPARRSLASIAQAMPGAWSVPRHLVSSGGDAPPAGGGLGLCRDLPRPAPGQRWKPLQVGYRSMAGGSPALLVAKFHELQALLGGGGALEDAEPSLEPAVRDVWRNRFWQRPRAPRSFGRLSSPERTAVLKGWLIAEHSDWADLRALMLRQQPTKPAKLPSQIWNRLVVEDTCQSSQALAELWELCQQPRNFVRYPLGVRSTLPDILFGRRLRWTRTPSFFSGCLQELGRLANIRGELRMAARTAVLLVRRLDSPPADWPPPPAAAKCRLLVCDVACSPSSPPLVRWWPREPLAEELARYLLLHLILAAPLQPGCPELSAAWAAAPPARRQGVLETGAGQHEQLQIWHQRDQLPSSSSSSRPAKRKRLLEREQAAGLPWLLLRDWCIDQGAGGQLLLQLEQSSSWDEDVKREGGDGDLSWLVLFNLSVRESRQHEVASLLESLRTPFPRSTPAQARPLAAAAPASVLSQHLREAGQEFLAQQGGGPGGAGAGYYELQPEPRATSRGKPPVIVGDVRFRRRSATTTASWSLRECLLLEKEWALVLVTQPMQLPVRGAVQALLADRAHDEEGAGRAAYPELALACDS